MTHMLKYTLAAVAITAAAPVAAQSVAVADLDRAVQASTAYVNAQNAIKVTYKAQIDQFTTRTNALNTELKPLADAFDTARKAPNANEAALRTQLQSIEQKRNAGQQELSTIIQPVQLAQAYVNEQIVAQLDGAIKRAMTKKKVNLVLVPQATVSYQPAVDITTDVTAELNTAIPNANIVPPAGWQPRQQGQQQGQAPAPAPATPQQQPQSR